MNTLGQSELKSLLLYDPETGIFTWLVGQDKGKKAGFKHCRGYLQQKIKTKKYLSHRLAWLYVYGEMPSGEIDHINGIRDDNRIINLRECSASQNQWNCTAQKNNTSGFKGVCWNKRAGKWHAQIMINLNKKHLGYFATAEQAGAAYQAKAKELHGEFFRNTNK